MESSSVSSSHLSLVSRAKTAFHSAAAKAEKVLTDIKADLKSDRGESDLFFHTYFLSQKGPRRSTDQETVASDASDKPQQEVLERECTREEDGLNTSRTLTIPSVSVIKQLASAIESGKNFKSINDLLTLAGDPSPIKDKTGLSLSVVKSLVLREREEKLSSEFCGDKEFHSLICSLFKSGEHLPPRNNGFCSEILPTTTLLKDLHGAPPESFVVQLSQIIGGFKSLQKMASFWRHVIVELRKSWSKGQPVPRMPLDAYPDLNSCLLHQKLQVINCCIARKQRRTIAKELLDSVLKEASLDSIYLSDHQGKLSPNCNTYVRTSMGEYVLRLGAIHPCENLTMLETDEPIYSPVTQEGPVLTEELIKETEEFVMRTGRSVCLTPAANPGCILEDFIRWHSPPDWMEMVSDDQVNDSVDGEGSSRQGQLSGRMQKEGNLWRELWETAKALPAVKQTPLFDEDLAVESILTTLEDIPPSELFEQLYISVEADDRRIEVLGCNFGLAIPTMTLCAGILAGEAALPADQNLSKLFYECKEYVIATYQSGMLNEKLGDLCKVYETVEAIVMHPEGAIMFMEQPDETRPAELKSRLKKFGLNFVGKDRQPLQKRSSRHEKKSEEKHMHVLSQLFDKKSYIFPRKNPKFEATPSTSAPSDDWTVV
ncbi:rab3 GTPase-activating protein catalytic subunit-like [Cocos nucifera]|uniref:Rab3 GTPase-activating protein catalytic subunit-like n=1 Tax=Cocos nucifera TaxID=13894 RepID=A0A8K0NCA4_COCNU|nr:rab3 GTPase-activating protein catalytic subunit-like [Cocos nucifera]